MITLGLDTTEVLGGVALWQGETLLGEMMMKGRLQHAEELLPLIERLLDECDRSKDEIELISVNYGPGSFTGLRIGLATAKGLCQSLKIPLVGVDGTIAYRVRLDPEVQACVLITNRRDLFYVRWFNGMKPLTDVEVALSACVLERISQVQKELFVVGSGVERLREQLTGLVSVKLGVEEMNCPSPAWIARLGKQNYSRDQLYELEPMYVEPVITR